MPVVRYHAADHRYEVEGRNVPGVSALISEAGLLGPVSQFYNEDAAERGSRIHRACLAHDLDAQLHVKDDNERAMLVSYLAWSRRAQPRWSYLEQPAYSTRYGFAGTADRIGMLNGRAVILDIKTGAVRGKPQPWHGVQLALYDLLYPFPLRRQRFGLYLTSGKGLPRIVEYTDTNDYNVALSLVPSGGGYRT